MVLHIFLQMEQNLDLTEIKIIIMALIGTNFLKLFTTFKSINE